MIYAAPFWCPKTKGDKFRSLQCPALPLTFSCEMISCHAKHKLLGLHFHIPVQNQIMTQKSWEAFATNRSWAPPLPSQTHGSCVCSTPGVSQVTHFTYGQYGVKHSSFNPWQRLQRHEFKRLPRAEFSNWRCPRLQTKKWGCSEVHSEWHAVLVQCVFAMPLLSCRYIV